MLLLYRPVSPLLLLMPLLILLPISLTISIAALTTSSIAVLTVSLSNLAFLLALHADDCTAGEAGFADLTFGVGPCEVVLIGIC